MSWLDAPENNRWLDLGCGTGALTAQILEHSDPKSVIGVEPSESFLSLARDQVGDQRAEFRQGDGENIPIADGEVDVAVSGLVLNFIPDQQNAVNELARTVGKGGTVAAYVWDYAGHAQFIRYFWDAAMDLDPAAREQHEGVRFPNCRPEALRILFVSAGLNNVVTAAIDIPTPFENFDDYWSPFLSGIGPAPGYCASLGEASQNRLKDNLKNTLPTDRDGMILLAARAWAVRGSR